MKKDFYFLSKDGETQIHAIEWVPDGEIRAVLQICHGMVEYIDRYDEFANYMNQKGYYVIGHDHLGHGESVKAESELGFFHEENGNEYVVGDIHEIRMQARRKHPFIPCFLLGHSMSSFLVRQYIQSYGAGLSGVILMGTGHQPYPFLAIAKTLCKLLIRFKGSHFRSSLIDGMAKGSFNRSFEPGRTRVDWISRDDAIVDSYQADPWCTFMFTVNGYYHMFAGMQTLTKKNIRAIPKDLPLLFISGGHDPVGRFGKSVKKVCNRYRNCGIQKVSMRLYKDYRHEILNEKNREVVFGDLYAWMERHCRSL